MSTNAYILNLGPEVNGGYIDAGATAAAASVLSVPDEKNVQQQQQGGGGGGLPPSWCGHLINHCGRDRRANVEVRSFLWIDVVGEEQLWSSVMDQYKCKGDNRHGTDQDNTEIVKLPNTMRLDGSPWYFDMVSQKTVMFPKPSQKYTVRSILPMLAGAAIVVSTNKKEGRHESPPPSLQPDEELFLHYSLKGPPYPPWAEGWYEE